MAAQNEEIEKDSGIEESMETSPQSETQLQKEGKSLLFIYFSEPLIWQDLSQGLFYGGD